MESTTKYTAQQSCRRNNGQNPNSLWNKLSVTQKYAARNLSNFGYDLTYIRNNNNDNLAILLCGDSIATIDGEGEINTDTTIVLR